MKAEGLGRRASQAPPFAQTRLTFAPRITPPENEILAEIFPVQSVLDQWWQRMIYRDDFLEPDIHQLLGEPVTEFYATSDEVAQNDRLLLQLTYDDNLHWNWGKAGVFFFSLDRFDFLKRDFSRVKTSNFMV